MHKRKTDLANCLFQNQMINSTKAVRMAVLRNMTQSLLSNDIHWWLRSVVSLSTTLTLQVQHAEKSGSETTSHFKKVLSYLEIHF